MSPVPPPRLLVQPLRRAVVLFLLLGLALAACAQPVVTAGPFRVGPTKAGFALVDDQGRTLYTNADDKDGVPSCTGDCADFWPPELAPPDAQPSGRLGVIRRPDGLLQWAWDGKPLYRYAGDTDPGDAWGEGLLARWHVVKA